MSCCASSDHGTSIAQCLQTLRAGGRLDQLVEALCREGGISCAREILLALQTMHDHHGIHEVSERDPFVVSLFPQETQNLNRPLQGEEGPQDNDIAAASIMPEEGNNGGSSCLCSRQVLEAELPEETSKAKRSPEDRNPTCMLQEEGCEDVTTVASTSEKKESNATDRFCEGKNELLLRRSHGFHGKADAVEKQDEGVVVCAYVRGRPLGDGRVAGIDKSGGKRGSFLLKEGGIQEGDTMLAGGGRICMALWAWHCKVAHDMAWEKLHTGPWRDVKVVWRDLFSLASYLLALSMRLQGLGREAMKALDMGILMGGPLYRGELDAEIASLQEASARLERAEEKEGGGGYGGEEPIVDGERENEKEQEDEREDVAGLQKCSTSGREISESLELSRPTKRHRGNTPPTFLREKGADLPWGWFKGEAVCVRELPSLEEFLLSFMLGGGGVGRPVVIKKAMDSWQAMCRWRDLGYLKRVAGARTVPIEVGQHYLAERWRQDLMTLEEFIDRHLAPSTPSATSAASAQSSPTSAGGSRVGLGADERGYLAQHQLFDQVPQLKEDIVVPEYCAMGGGELQSINAWFGPKGTVTPIHHDPHHNLLCQVVGRKYVRLFSAVENERMYPHPQVMLHNSSQVDIDFMDHKRWPQFGDVAYFECVLEEGDMVYIPPKWWHYVRSLTPSFSVSFWWASTPIHDEEDP